MRTHNLSAVLVYGDTTLGNPELAYVTRVQLPRGGLFFKPRSGRSMLVVGNLDIGTARRGSVGRVLTYSDFGYMKLVKRYGRAQAYPRLIDEILRTTKTHGRVAIYGRNETATATALIDTLRRLGHKVVGESSPTVLDEARSTKDPWELKLLRDVGKRTSEVIEETLDFLRNCRRRTGSLFWKGRPVTIGLVKSEVKELLLKAGLSAPEDVIFAQGKSSADPHNRGNEKDRVRCGRVIVFDLFPQNSSGYWFDVTRSFVVGRAPREIRHMFNTVLNAQDESLDAARAGVPCEDLMNKVCDTIEKAGYLTVRAEMRGLREARFRGFNHGLGHGVGLTIGEAPFLGLFVKNQLKPRNVVTIEPGIYEPKLGGVRLEDTIIVLKGKPENLTRVEKELEI